MRHHKHYIDPTAQAAIKRADRPRKKPRPWGDRLAYTVGEVMKGILRWYGRVFFVLTIIVEDGRIWLR